MVIAIKNKIESLIFLRAIAVLLVCFCHFAKPLSAGYVYSPIFLWINDYGKYGVEMFFVISGFVIPFSLERANYQIKDYFTFLWKRVIRLHPAYLVAIALTLIITYFSFKQKHEAFPETISSITNSILCFQNLGLNAVFWTLKIEAEYYIFIGLFFILLKQFKSIALYLVIPALLIASQFDYFNGVELLKHLVFFLIGTVGFLIYSKRGKALYNYVLLGLLIIFSFLFTTIPGIIDSIPASIAGACTIAFILLYKGRTPKSMRFIGNISYSMYLIHYPIAKQLIRLLMRFLPSPIAWVLFFIAFIIVIPVAWLFYQYIEEPSEKQSRKIKYLSAKAGK